MFKWLKNFFTGHRCVDCYWCNKHKGIFTREVRYVCIHHQKRIPVRQAKLYTKCECFEWVGPNVYDMDYGNNHRP